MSNSLAIAAVTATLRQLLAKVAEPLPLDPIVDGDLADATCTARPPDKARSAEDANQINVFLYATQPNAALRNAGMTGTSNGDRSISPLALNLYYLVTAYGRDHDDVLGHRLLGRAMMLLHDYAILKPADIEKALPGADLSRQFEQVRISPQPMSTEELSKLWTTFQTPYRLSAAYEVRVLLMESMRQSKAAMPVLRRGKDGQGPQVDAQLLPAVPGLDTYSFLNKAASQPAARLPYPPASLKGDTIVFAGHDLTGVETDALFMHRLTSITVAPPTIVNSNINGFTLELPDTPGVWPAGLYAVGAQCKPSIGDTRTTNVLAIAIAPRIVAVPASPVHLDADGNVQLTITISPPVWAKQRVSLLVGDLEYAARPLPDVPATTTQVTFDVRGRDPGLYPLRVRVDGIDSFVADYSSEPPVLDPGLISLELQP